MAGSVLRHHVAVRRVSAAALASLLAVAVASSPARAGLQWHPDLATARSAAAASQKPVLAVFTAGWSPESTAFENQVLTATETEAVIHACFEPVRIDADQRPGLVKRLGVAHVPSACVLDASDAVLTRFDCPSGTTAFVAALAKAAQDAASAARRQASATTTDPAAERGSPADLSGSGFATSRGDGSPMTEKAAAGAGSGSISMVTAKVRQLSDFATLPPGEAAAATASQPPRPASRSELEPAPSRFVSTSSVEQPVLPRTPPAWPAEPAGGSAFTNGAVETATAHGAIEPKPMTPAGTPWLAATPPPAEPDSSATATDLPQAGGKPSGWSSFVAAFQKPFNVFSKPVTTSAPATMPAARPTSPLAAAAATGSSSALAATEAPDSPAGPDPYGSMPLGLEGYCPVTVAERGVWTEGRAQWGARHRGRTYLFAGPEQQQAFLASPDRYAPALSGDDPVAVIDQGRSTPGRRAYGVTYQSRMYLFSSPESRTQFAANPDRYTGAAMLAERPAPADAVRRY